MGYDFAAVKYVDSTRSIVSYDTSASTFTGGILVYSFSLSDANSLADNLMGYDFAAVNGESFTVVLESNDGSANNTPAVSLTWAEEQ